MTIEIKTVTDLDTKITVEVELTLREVIMAGWGDTHTGALSPNITLRTAALLHLLETNGQHVKPRHIVCALANSKVERDWVPIVKYMRELAKELDQCATDYEDEEELEKQLAALEKEAA